LWGLVPVSNDVREGLHAGEEQYAWVKKTPLDANRSRLGVLMGLFALKSVIQSFKSSTAMNSTLGLVSGFRWHDKKNNGQIINNLKCLIAPIFAAVPFKAIQFPGRQGGIRIGVGHGLEFVERCCIMKCSVPMVMKNFPCSCRKISMIHKIL